MGAEWESEAEDWVRWARTPGHDAYWYYRDSFFDSILSAPGRRTLEIGCGEGRVARDLAAHGHQVVAIDTSAGLLRYARHDDPAGSYALADSAALPFPADSFDVAVAYNSLQVVDEMAVTVGEAARVLDHGGYLCVCVVHPATDLGSFRGGGFTMREQYFEKARVEDTVRLDGLTMTFRGWTYTLEQYALALEGAGLYIEAIREPKPIDAGGRYERWQYVPLFLFFRAVKP